MLRVCLLRLCLGTVWLCVAVEAHAQSGAMPCSGSICVDTVATRTGVQLRVSNGMLATREVNLQVFSVGYDVDPSRLVHLTLEPGEARVAATLTRQDTARRHGYRWLWDAQPAEAAACRMGVCIRSERTEAAYTLTLQNRLTVPVRVLPYVEMQPLDTFALAPGERVRLLRAPGRSRAGAFRLQWVDVSQPPDTTVAYALPVSQGRVMSTGLPPEIVSLRMADTTAFARSMLRQNRYVYRFSVAADADLRAARRGIVIVVADTSFGRTEPSLSPPSDSLLRRIRASMPQGQVVEVQRRRGPDLNHVFVRHDDGTVARYLGLGRGASRVTVGDTVDVGAVLGQVDAGREVHFSVVEFGGRQTTIPVRMRVNGTARRLRPGETVRQD